MPDVDPGWAPPEPPPPGHPMRYADKFRSRLVCLTCGTISLPDFTARLFVPADVDWEGPDDEPILHVRTFSDFQDAAAVVDEPEPTPPAPTEAPADHRWRRENGLDRYPKRTANTPSRSSEARQRENAAYRAKRKAAAAAV